MTPREPEEFNRSLRRWLWQEEQRWKCAGHADGAQVAFKGWLGRKRAPTGDERKAASAGPTATITPKTALRARNMLGLEWSDVEKLSGIIASAIIGYETSGRSTASERRRLQQFYEREGLAFSADGGVAWAK